ncbi:hypothetical protein GALL_508590 [mine drainage metagenome]|uniref:Uncharacterized protein n=1 Tax=mine drainage metagenome TaxID=410659 RepID=A0A1J5PIE3_9ZZZZ
MNQGSPPPFAHRVAAWAMRAVMPEAAIFHPAQGLFAEFSQDSPCVRTGDDGSEPASAGKPEGVPFPSGKALVFLGEHRDFATWAVDGFLEVPVWEMPKEDASDWAERLPASKLRLKLADSLVFLGYHALKMGLGLLRGRQVGSEVDQIFLERLDGTSLAVQGPGRLEGAPCGSSEFQDRHNGTSYPGAR